MRAHLAPSLVQERGVYVVLLSIAIVALLALIGLALDGGRIFLAHQRLQRAVDAAALANMDLMSSFPRALLENDIEASVRENLRLVNLEQEISSISANVNQALGRIRISATLDLPLFFLPVLPGIPKEYPLSADVAAGNGSITVMLVLDVSGSMDEPIALPEADRKIAKLKAGVTQFVNQLEANDYVGIVTFSDRARIRQRMVAATPSNKTAIATMVDSFDADGATCMSCGIQRGRIELLRADNGVPEESKKYVVLFTDGVPEYNTDPYSGTQTNYNQTETFSSGTSCGWTGTANDFSQNDRHQRRFYHAIAESDLIRRFGIPVFTIGVGEFGAELGDICRGSLAWMNYGFPNRNPWQSRGCSDSIDPPSSADLSALRPFLLMRLANTDDLDFQYQGPVPGPESPMSYNAATGILRGRFPPFTPNNVTIGSDCVRADGTFDDSKQNCACIPRTGPAYPRGAFLAAQTPSQIVDRFQTIFSLIKKPRLFE